MSFERRSRRWRCARQAVAAVAVATAFAATGAVAHADPPPSCATAGSAPYELALRALTGPNGAELTVAVEPAAGCAAVTTVKKVQVKTFGGDGVIAAVRNMADVPAPAGVATLDLGLVPRERRVEVDALVQPDEQGATYVLRADTTIRLRPNLSVTAVAAPAQTLTTRPVDVRAEVAELNGDTAATARVTLAAVAAPLETKEVTVEPGARTWVTFAGVALTAAAPAELSVIVSEAAPGETDEADNFRDLTIDVTEHELVRGRVVFPSLGGYGVQMNGHVYAGVLPAPPSSMPDLEAKVRALEPQFVRIFYSPAQEAIPERMESFAKTVELAQEAGATINITYQSVTAQGRLNPDPPMGAFADVLEYLIRTRGLTNVRWATIQNEPNRTQMTLPQYEGLNRALHQHLVSRGLRDHVRLMGGDLVEFGELANLPNPDHHVWWDYMAAHMNDVLDAYSVHIYWNYWDIPRMEFRLKDVLQIVQEDLPPEARKPVYVTEFGVRGIVNFPGKPAFQPGYWADGTPLARTNIAAFQQLWFSLVATQLGYAGVAKWDAYWGKYDASYNQSHFLIGPPEEGWPLFPAYHAFRLLLQTTDAGWQVLGVDPWLDDDWKLDASGRPYDPAEKELVAYAGPNDELTLFGLDTAARGVNGAAADVRSYSVGGLPAYREFSLVVWNASANGENALVGTVRANAAGVARFDVPLHGAFALTTVPVS